MPKEGSFKKNAIINFSLVRREFRELGDLGQNAILRGITEGSRVP
jgi:hypothetical protein